LVTFERANAEGKVNVRKTLNVLIVEDSRDDTELIKRVLKKGDYDVNWERVETEEAMIETLKRQKWDIIISDYYMPRFSGLEALEIAKKKAPDLPFILVSGIIGEDVAVEAMKKGAHDYITKGKMKRLVPAVQRELAESTMRRKKKKTEEELRLKNNAVESATEALVIANVEGEIVYVNQAFSGMYGLNTKEAIGKHFSRIILDDTRMQSILKALRNEGIWNGELKSYSVDGIEFDINLSAQMITDEKGNPNHIMGIIRDITEWKKAENRIKHLNNVLNSIRNITQLIAREKDRSTLMKKVCKNFIRTNEYAAAWITLLNDDKNIIKIESAGSGISFLERLKETKRNNNLNCVRQAVTISEIQTFTDLKKSCQKCPFRESCPGGVTISPMSYENKIYGTMAVLHLEGFVPDTEEKNLLKEVSDDLGFAFYNIELEEESRKNKRKLKESLEKVQKFLDGTVKALSSVVEKRDPYTAGHQKRVAELAVALGKELGLDEERLEALRMASLLHDIGKIHVRAGILNKLSKLDNLEMNIIKTHPKEGYEILKSVDFPGPVAEIVLQHHERLDGSGYPQGLTAEEIRLEAKILAVADVVEAYTSKRPYRPPYSFEDTLKSISEDSGKLYDRDVVEKCIKLFKEKTFSFTE
jgi:PAS domain S-box-containing protein/putative nucleotidyltransferase with HDIG domain